MALDTLVNELRVMAARDDLPQDARDRIRSAIVEVQGTPLRSDVWIYRFVVSILGARVLITVIGGIALTFYGKGATGMQLPDAIVAIGSAAVGALAGLLAPSPTQKN
jgi:hypothetical protein